MNVSVPGDDIGVELKHQPHAKRRYLHRRIPSASPIMNPHITLPRPTGGSSNFGSTTPSTRRSEIKMPRFFKRLFKFPQMDFEMALWEIMSLIIAPKKVFRQIYYHVRLHFSHSSGLVSDVRHARIGAGA